MYKRRHIAAAEFHLHTVRSYYIFKWQSGVYGFGRSSQAQDVEGVQVGNVVENTVARKPGNHNGGPL